MEDAMGGVSRRAALVGARIIAMGLILGATLACAAERRTIDLGGAITLDYDADHWRIAETALAPGESALLSCHGRNCPGGGLVFLHVAREANASCPTPREVEPDPDWGRRRSDPPLTRRIGGLVIHGQIWHSPCRNYVPPRQQICTVHAGVVVIMGSSGVSCRSAPGVSRSEFEELVSGLAARREGPQ